MCYITCPSLGAGLSILEWPWVLLPSVSSLVAMAFRWLLASPFSRKEMVQCPDSRHQSLRWLKGLGQSVDVIKSMFSGCRIGSMLQPLHQWSCYYSSGMYEVPVHRRNIWNQWTDLRFSTVSGSEELLPNPRGGKRIFLVRRFNIQALLIYSFIEKELCNW